MNTNQYGMPNTLFGMPVYEVPNKYVPILQLSEDFTAVSEEFRAKQNAWLLEKFGTRDVSIIPKDQVFMISYGIMMRPEHSAILRDLTA